MSYYNIKITGKDVKRFILNLYKMHINFYNIEYSNNSVVIKVNHFDYIKIKNIKTIYEISIIDYYGIARIKYFIKKYFIFLIMSLFSIILLLFLTHIIFSIKIENNNSELNKLLLESLKQEGIAKYKFVKSYEKIERIKEKILVKYKDKIEWLEIKRIGTKYIVNLEERKINNKTIDNTPRNIIAAKNGIITKIVSEHGEIVGKVDSYVKKGDILISGTIHKKEDIVDNIHADGKVLAEVWYTVDVMLPYHYEEEIKTNSHQTFINISFFNKNLKLFRFKNYTNSKNKYIYKYKNTLLPIGISLNEETKINKIDQVYTYENAISKASSLARKKLYDKLGNDIEIKLEKKLKYEEINSKIRVVMFYKVIEDITSYQDIDLTNLNVTGN